MSKIYPKIVKKIYQKIKELQLEIIGETPEELINQKKRFYRTICKTKTNKKIFFKSLLFQEKGIKRRFRNEISFSLFVKKQKNHPLYPFLPKLLNFSLAGDFLYKCEEFLPGYSKKGEDFFSKKELIKIVNLLILIKNTPYQEIPISPKKGFFSFSSTKKRIKEFLQRTILAKNIKVKIFDIFTDFKKIFKEVKPALSHGDFSEANLIFLKDRIKIVDWEHIGIRNPLYDFADLWLKRRKFKNEQSFLREEFYKNSGKKFFFELFKLALLEITVRDIALFSKVIIEAKKEKNKRKEKIFHLQLLEYLDIIKKEIL